MAHVAVGAGLHDAAFHRGQHEFGQLAPVAIGWQALACGVETFDDGVGPAGEVDRQRFAHRWIGFVDFQRQAADRAAVSAVGIDHALPVARQQREHALDGIAHAGPCRRQQHRMNPLAVGLQHGQQQVLLPREEVIQAAAVDTRCAQYIGDAGRAVALGPEQAQRGENQSVTGIGTHGSGLG